MATLTEALNLARSHLAENRRELADEIARRILAADPGFGPAWHLRGEIAYGIRQLGPAAEYFHRAVTAEPDNAGYYNDLGMALGGLGHFAEAEKCFRKCLDLQPDFAPVYSNLGNMLHALGKLDEAIACYQRAIREAPHLVMAHNNLGNAWLTRGRPDEAVICYRAAIERDPNYVEPNSNIGPALQALGRVDEAIAYCQRAVQMRPEFANAHANLGSALQDRGQLREAIASFRRTLELQPDDSRTHSNLLFAMHFCPEYDGRALLEEHLRWNQRHAQPLVRLRKPHANDRTPERRLRIGYVSADFRGHPVGHFILPLLEAHDRAGFEVCCYSSVAVEDSLTARCRASTDVWRVANGLNDEQLAERVRADRIDVLVDLAMHAGGNRLLTFARKPAPVQVTYLSYCGTTGVTGLDYRLTDPYLDPPDVERHYSEESVWLPETYWCYRTLVEPPEVNGSPALATGQVTFGCLSNSSKLSEPALTAWAAVLDAVPGARLLLHAREGGQRERVRQILARRDVAAERIEFVDRASLWQYYSTYHRLDVALDPFPYGGGATTCDALWMGVPVVSLACPLAVGRGGLSILSNAGLPELVAHDVQQYVGIAAQLAGDPARLATLRAGLRQQMRDSPVTNSARFARHVEAAYRTMWRRWCAGGTGCG